MVLYYVMLFNLIVATWGHGLLLTPRPRSGGEGIMTRGATFWYSQSCNIGCAECNISAAVRGSMTAGDLCPSDRSGGDKLPTINDPKHRTWMGAGCFEPGTNNKAPCTSANADTDWTKHHPWRAPGRAPMYDPCGVAGASPSNNSQQAGGWGYTTGHPQGFKGSHLPPLANANKTVWMVGGEAEVAWTSAANHGGGYQYSLCPLVEGKALTEECFRKFPLHFVDNKQKLRYIYLNNTANHTEVDIEAVRVSQGTTPEGSTWTKHPVPGGVDEPSWGSYGRNGRKPQFEPPPGCDEHCWGYQPCNIGFTHPSYEGWNDPKRGPTKSVPYPGRPAPSKYPACADGKDGEGCCHTSAYMAVVDRIQVPDLPAGDYVLRWRWDCEQTPQIWANCADIVIQKK